FPAYVVLDEPLGLPINGVENWQSGFLPPLFQGTRFRSTGSPVLNLRPDVDRPANVVQAERELLTQLDHRHKRQRPGQPNLDARIASYELAARMQLKPPDRRDTNEQAQPAATSRAAAGSPRISAAKRRLTPPRP